MTPHLSAAAQRQDVAVDLTALLDLILEAQRPDGAIAWWPGHKADPWDHVESAMGLTIGGAFEPARRAYEWLRGSQLPDGSWYAADTDGRATDRTRETHHAAYLAAGLYHFWLATGDLDFVAGLWPTVERAMAFVFRCQAATGEIYWAISPEEKLDRMALVTGCSSIHFSLRCALALARLLGLERASWRRRLCDLKESLIHRPHRFNTTKSRFSMDWFYPVLGGVLTGEAARQRMDRYWKKFVVRDLGVRCVSDQPWVTVAETCELILALAAMGDHQKARILFRWICDRTFEDHTYWCGFNFPDMVVWPEEKITWNNAVVMMAVDALYHLTPSGVLFAHEHWRHMDL
ncbi:MAG: terpene cyclase/mutase family protein [Desulfatitalea sp.]|nr:phenyltransferase domain-containing protein [Desulfatitalea sp.]NNK02671.1 terpene cyclase/mutase family protein [Desulfatitalea sp.]